MKKINTKPNFASKLKIRKKRVSKPKKAKQTLKTLHIEANEIVSSVFKEIGAKIANISATTLINTYSKDKLYFGLTYFIVVNNTNIHGDVNGKSYNEALEKLRIKANFDKETYKNTLTNADKKQSDIELDVN